MTGPAPRPRFGAVPIGPDRTRFGLWAPALSQASVEIEGLAPVPMRVLEDGWFEAEAACGPGARYRFRVGPDLLVPDPASRAQAGDVDGPSLVVDPESYAWRTEGWKGRPWEETVVCEVHAGLMGGFAGVAERLPALAELGVTAIELMPIADFAGARNWGYDGVLPYAPDAAYGSPDDLKALVDRAHELGLMIFLDVVYNHFGPAGNYLHAYAPQMFDESRHTPWGGAIDFARPEVRRFFTENALMWVMDYRFDGLRLDAVHAISRQDWLPEMAEAVHKAAGPDRHVHLMLENEANTASLLGGPPKFDAQWNDDFHNVLHVLLTGESRAYYRDFADDPAARLARCLGEGFIYQGEPSPNHDGAPRGEPSAHLGPTNFISFLQNHDQIGNRAMGERLTVLADPAALRAATALLILCPQIPLIFMGDEVGATTPFLFFTDFDGDLADAVREGRRKEFAKFSEFSDPARRAQIPDPNAVATFEASRVHDNAESDAWRAQYRELLWLRREHLVGGLKGARALGAGVIGDKAVRARWRLGDGRTLMLALNLGSADVQLDPPDEPPLYLIGLDAGVAATTLSPASFVAWLSEAEHG